MRAHILGASRDRSLLRARESFLTDTALDDSVSNWVRVSWERSREAHVDVDRPRARFVDSSRDTPFTRAAGPVLASLAGEIENEPVCLILTDANGTVLDRRGGDPQLINSLDRVDLAPGFQYAESNVGTNGIGTAIEVGGPVLVEGGEHYNSELTQFSCAGALVTHPVTGVVLGVVDITTKAENTNSLLVSFAKLAARRIQERILEGASALEIALLGDYHAACKHSGRPVIAIGEDVLMMNAVTHQYFDAPDQAAIIAQTQEVRGSAENLTIVTDLPSGVRARLSYQPSFAGAALAGGIVLVREQTTRSPRGATGTRIAGMVGSSPLWQRVSHEVQASYGAGEWLVLEGERGVGKCHLLRAVRQHAHPSHPVAVYSAHASETASDLLDAVGPDIESGADLIVRNADRLSPDAVDALADVLQECASAEDRPWVAVTTSSEPESEAFVLRLQPLFARTIGVPPLRHHPEDIPDLVKFFLERAGSAVTASGATLNQLARLPWPGNVSQLRSVLDEIGKHRRTGTLEVDDLPPECRATSRRRLTRLESLERDAIVDALRLHHGDKRAAAEALGMSRATIYRKIRDFGIV